MYAIEHSGVVPDLLISAKSLGGGMPISAVTGRAEIMDSPHVGGVGSTYGGNPLACVAAVESLKYLSRPEVLARATRIEQVIRDIFEPLKTEVPVLGDVRGVGAMMVIEFVKDKTSKEPWPDFAMNTIKYASQRGVILIRAGLYSNCIRFLPALDIAEDMLAEALGVVAEGVRATHKDMMVGA
jgi:4-aminobutyrate aminotransferase/(S)-3-amino-2-methylpropionate transaminase